MQDCFYEECCLSKNRTLKSKLLLFYKALYIICYVLAVAWVVIMYNLFPTNDLPTISIVAVLVGPAVVLCLTGFLFQFLRDKIVVDFDYTFITGSIRFSKVFREVKRKEVLSFDCSDIECLGLCDSKSFDRFLQMPNINKIELTYNKTPDDDKKFYFIVCSVKAVKYILILECTKTFISNVVRFAKPTIIDEGSKNDLLR